MRMSRALWAAVAPAILSIHQAATAFDADSWAASLKSYGAAETRNHLAEITIGHGETVADVVRGYALIPATSTWSAPDEDDLHNGYQRGDLIVTVYFDDGGPELGHLPCGLHARGGSGLAEFVKRRGKWSPESQLARWIFTRRCP